jgi:hypothetical protein
LIEDDRMDRHWAYCSACDRQVEVMVTPSVDPDPATGEPVQEIVCLEVGHTCTGALCPITDVLPDRMRDALRRMEPERTSESGEE